MPGKLKRALFVFVLGMSDFGAAPRAPATYENLVRILAASPVTGRPVQSVEELMPLLPAELRSNFTLVHHSRGPVGDAGSPDTAEVSPAHPRLLMFSDDGRLVVAISGDPARPHYDTLEAIHFDDRSARFHLSRFILPAAAARLFARSIEASGNGSLDPPECLHCHGDDPRPILDSYPLWPGFYGSVADTFPAGSEELTWYRQFLDGERHAATGIYRFLLFTGASPVTPYIDPRDYDPKKTEVSSDTLARSPNTRLGMALNELNRKRIQRKLEASPDYERYKHALVSGLLGCTGLPVSRDARERSRAGLLAAERDVARRLGFDPGEALAQSQRGFQSNMAQLDYLGNVLGVSRHDWWLTFEDGHPYFDGILSGLHAKKNFYLKEDFLIEMLADLAAGEPEMRRYVRTYSAFGGAWPFGHRLDFDAALAACGPLRKKLDQSRTELPEVPELPKGH